jgi:hypothetical protein
MMLTGEVVRTWRVAMPLELAAHCEGGNLFAVVHGSIPGTASGRLATHVTVFDMRAVGSEPLFSFESMRPVGTSGSARPAGITSVSFSPRGDSLVLVDGSQYVAVYTLNGILLKRIELSLPDSVVPKLVAIGGSGELFVSVQPSAEAHAYVSSVLVLSSDGTSLICTLPAVVGAVCMECSAAPSAPAHSNHEHEWPTQNDIVRDWSWRPMLGREQYALPELAVAAPKPAQRDVDAGLAIFDDAWSFSDGSSDAGSDSDASGDETPIAGVTRSESAVLCFVVAGPSVLLLASITSESRAEQRVVCVFE